MSDDPVSSDPASSDPASSDPASSDAGPPTAVPGVVDDTTPWRSIGGGQWVGTDPSRRFPVYTRGNIGEVYPEVLSPLSYSMVAEALEQAFRNAMVVSGLLRRREIEGEPLSTGLGLGVFGGYGYLNLSTRRMVSARFPGGSAADADVSVLGVGQVPPHEPSPDEKNLRASFDGLRYLVKVLRTRELPELDADRRRVDAFLEQLPDPATVSEQELRELSTGFVPLFLHLVEHHLVTSGSAELALSALSQFCDRAFGEPHLAIRLLGGLGQVDSAAPSSELWDLSRHVVANPSLASEFDGGVTGLLERLGESPDPAVIRFMDAFAGFRSRFGSRGPNEWDTAFETWGTDPSLALHIIDRMRGADETHDPRTQQLRQAEEAAALRRSSAAQLARPLRPLFTRLIEAAALFSRGRERAKTTVVDLIHGGRMATRELDRRIAERSGRQRGDLWFVTEPELDAYIADPDAFAPVIAERRALHAELSRRVPPFFFSGQIPPLETWELKTAERTPVVVGETLGGLPGCAGSARGRARVVLDAADPGDLGPGDILVAPLTDPSWTPLFLAAAGVVVDVGAIMSHAAIVSRELGIPCAVSVTDATRRIPDGALIEVDGGTGQVTVIDLS